MSDDAITVSELRPSPIQLWGSLEILQEIGRGGFGVVYRAWEPALAREVALKIIRPRDVTPETLASILREGQLLARVRHPNVVTVYGAQQIGDEVGLWMEFVRGQSLSQLVKRDGLRAAEEAAVIGISLCQATAAVHQAGVLHRDIKAHNVMREAGGRIVLMDLGAGQLLEGPRKPDEHITGTPAYMAPEVLAGGRASTRSDIYSLGVLLYYLVSGTYPVEGHTWTDYLMAHARFERRPLGDVRPDIQASFVRVVERATALNPDDRYSTPGAMLTDLSKVAAGGQAVRARRSGTDSRRRKPAPGPALEPGSNHWLRAGIWSSPILVPLVLGTITSGVFNFTIGRPLAFAPDETVLSWWVWGVRALIPGAVEAIAIVLICVFAGVVWKLLARLSTPVARFTRRLREARLSLAARLGLRDPETAAQALLGAQILGLIVFCWYFRDIFNAMTSFITEASAEEIRAFRPDDPYLAHQQFYNFWMAMMILGMIVGVRHIVRMRREEEARSYGSLAAVVGVIGLAFVVLVVPYRLIWHNRFELAAYEGSRCYILGQREVTALLYCPGDPVPKVKQVRLEGELLQRSGIRESIYTPSMEAQ